MFRSRSEFEEALLKNIKYYTSVLFLGRGKYESYKFDTYEEAIKAKFKNKTQSLPLVYAVCEYANYDHTIYVGPKDSKYG